MKTLRWILRKWSPTICVYPNPFKICEYWEISRRLGRNSKGSLLDLGCGGGLQTVLLSRRFGTVVGVDIDDSQFADARCRLHRWNRHRIRFLHGDLFDLDLAPGSVDAVVSFSVLEHIVNWEGTLREVFRLLRPGGQLVISVDTLEAIGDAALVQTHMRAYSVQHYFSQHELEASLRGVGFRVARVHPIFTSRFARELFIRGIRRDFKFGRAVSVLNALRLMLLESGRAPTGTGIFLIADATK